MPYTNYSEFRAAMADALPEDSREDFLSFADAHEKEYSDYRESSEARFAEFTNRQSTMTEEINALKARNYDLLMQIPKDDGGGDAPVVSTKDDSGEIYHIDSLFKDYSGGVINAHNGRSDARRD